MTQSSRWREDTANNQTQNMATCAFTSAVMLYLALVQDETTPCYSSALFLTEARRCRDSIACVVLPGSLMQRYVLILDHMKNDILGLSRPAASNGTAFGLYVDNSVDHKATRFVTGPSDSSSSPSVPTCSQRPVEETPFLANGLPDKKEGERVQEWRHLTEMIGSGIATTDDALQIHDIPMPTRDHEGRTIWLRYMESHFSAWDARISQMRADRLAREAAAQAESL